MLKADEILTIESMKLAYGEFFNRSPHLPLDRSRIPEEFHPLIPYAAFWGLSDDWSREDLLEAASSEIQCNLKTVVSIFDAHLQSWLEQLEAESSSPTDEYIAFIALIMAADYIPSDQCEEPPKWTAF